MRSVGAQGAVNQPGARGFRRPDRDVQHLDPLAPTIWAGDPHLDRFDFPFVSGQTEDGAIRSATGTARKVRPCDYTVAGKPHAVGAREP